MAAPTIMDYLKYANLRWRPKLCMGLMRRPREPS
jgi:hypothetical protein